VRGPGVASAAVRQVEDDSVPLSGDRVLGEELAQLARQRGVAFQDLDLVARLAESVDDLLHRAQRLARASIRLEVIADHRHSLLGPQPGPGAERGHQVVVPVLDQPEVEVLCDHHHRDALAQHDLGEAQHERPDRGDPIDERHDQRDRDGVGRDPASADEVIAIGRAGDAFSKKAQRDHRERHHSPRDVGAHQRTKQDRGHHQRRHGAQNHGETGIAGKLDVLEPRPQDLDGDDRESNQDEAGKDPALMERDRDENGSKREHTQAQSETGKRDDDRGGRNQQQIDDVIPLARRDVVE
jgi:hypothetical protein